MHVDMAELEVTVANSLYEIGHEYLDLRHC